MTTGLDQVPFGASGFAENPGSRCLCLFLLDALHSMQGDPINALNDGHVPFKNERVTDTFAMKQVEIAIIAFGPVNVLSDYSGRVPTHEVGQDRRHADGRGDLERRQPLRRRDDAGGGQARPSRPGMRHGLCETLGVVVRFNNINTEGICQRSVPITNTVSLKTLDRPLLRGPGEMLQ